MWLWPAGISAFLAAVFLVWAVVATVEATASSAAVPSTTTTTHTERLSSTRTVTVTYTESPAAAAPEPAQPPVRAGDWPSPPFPAAAGREWIPLGPYAEDGLCGRSHAVWPSVKSECFAHDGAYWFYVLRNVG